jgi:multiple sugar transport system permease protein
MISNIFSGKNRSAVNEAVWAYILLLPAVLLFLTFVLIPLISTFVISFFDWNMLSNAKFIGLGNYKEIVSDERLGVILKNTLFFTVFAVIIKVVLGLVVALLVSRIKVKTASSTLESIYFFPMILPMAVVTMVWGLLLNTDIGVINGFLNMVGIQKIPWLTNAVWAMRSIILLDVWKGLGFYFIIYLVALRNVPKEFYEAADIDGAKSWKKFLHITLPFISPTTLFLSVMAIIGALQVFDQAYILTKGGPGDATMTMVFYIWQSAFQSMNMGYGTTLALLLFVLIMFVTLIQFIASKKWVFYQ